jgi:eukaryotic-like serine/threonine-protein kinase
VAPTPLAPGVRFGAYRLIRPLGQGGFAEVWEAESDVNGRRVALKVLTELRAESERALERFRQEGRIAGALTNPHCVYVFDAGAHEGLPFIAMELVAGGTLADRIAGGPLPARVAVDVVLDVLEGLEAAQQAGILHRDVKPSNVFLDADGRAKIGDFGISKSLEVDSHLSQTGAFLGTPYYASPEQIAAEPLDLRSDLYSVGAMLYELVTGKLPYAGTNASQVLAQVLTREPVPFAQQGVAVPAALQRVVLRLLAKAKEKRFQSYEQLRAALVPLSSHGLAPAGRARRFGAILLDWLLFIPLGMAMGTAAMLQQGRGGSLVLASVVIPALQFVYFTLTERYWGGSVGKHALGLRVTGADGGTPSLGRVAWRTGAFLLLYAGPSVVVQMTGGGNLAASPWLRFAAGIAQLLMVGLLISTMRRRNGYAGLHEIASGTRVVAVLSRERAAPVPRVAPAVTPAPASGVYGPYHTTGTLWRDGRGAVLLAHDAELHRDVWIHEVGMAAALPVDRLRARGEGSLPWLQRGERAREGGEGIWDAYGAPQGTALEPWAVGRRGLSWREMRDVLASLARELESRLARDGTAGSLSARQVWVEASGRALLLDFPVSQLPGAPEDAAVEVTASNWREFLRRIAVRGFQRDAVPLPEYARGIMATLEADGSSAATGTIADFRAALEGVATRPAEVTRARRAGPLAVLALVPAFMVLLRLAVPLMMTSMPPWYRDLAINSGAYLTALQRADSAGEAADSVTRRTATSLRIVLASDLLEARRAQQTAGAILAGLPPELRAALDSAVRRYPSPDPGQVADARSWLAAGHVSVPQVRGGVGVVPKVVLESFTVLAYLGAAGVVLALLLRGGVLFGLFGIGVVRANGAPAGRLRCGARALVAWSPLLLILALTAWPRNLTFNMGGASVHYSSTTPRARAPEDRPASPWMRWGLVVVALGGVAAAVWRPTRGPAERLCGVVLVPK